MERYFLLSSIYLVWELSILFALIQLNVINSKNILIGPSNNTTLTFINLKIDNWGTWCLASIYIFIDHLLAKYLEYTVDMWLTNNLRNESKYINFIEYKNRVVMVHLITQIYHIASWLDYIVYIIIIVNRFDILMFGMLAESIAIYITTRGHIKRKEFILPNHSLNEEFLYPLGESVGTL